MTEESKRMDQARQDYQTVVSENQSCERELMLASQRMKQCLSQLTARMRSEPELEKRLQLLEAQTGVLKGYNKGLREFVDHTTNNVQEFERYLDE